LSQSLGIAYWVNGDLRAASEALTEAVLLSQAVGRTYLTMVVTTTLGHVQEMQGLLRQSVDTHREALELATGADGRAVPSAALAYVGIAEPLYEWNDLEGALCYATEGIRLSELGGRQS
jgi:ATP/maltotriose-dependent transcriptional regulator MalT